MKKGIAIDNLVNKYKPTKEIIIVEKDSKGNNKKPAVKVVPNYYVERGDEIEIISESCYVVYREGFMYIAENKRKERFTIDSSLVRIKEKPKGFSLDDDDETLPVINGFSLE